MSQYSETAAGFRRKKPPANQLRGPKDRTPRMTISPEPDAVGKRYSGMAPSVMTARTARGIHDARRAVRARRPAISVVTSHSAAWDLSMLASFGTACTLHCKADAGQVEVSLTWLRCLTCPTCLTARGTAPRLTRSPAGTSAFTPTCLGMLARPVTPGEPP